MTADALLDHFETVARCASSADAADAVIRVEDSGMGIPADLLPRVFDLFVQGRQGASARRRRAWHRPAARAEPRRAARGQRAR